MDKKPVFVIHKHFAKNLHYDLRLEKDGVLKSWAVPKEPVNDSSVKRLAIQVADHTLEYGGFSGEIPEGQYGAGKVEIWDTGSYSPVKFEKDEVVFDLSGKRLKGKFCLIKLKRSNPAGKNWLFFKISKKTIDKP
ncbi:MAG: hypothetical protein JW983_01630 [Elusimicrobia bacterium]|nr:hypothetical protein [Elusimicrobiota bacterium]